jgi:AhpD family alkylhydroperoxidase
MARHAERLLGREEAAEACCPARTAFGELVCVAASHAINCVDNLEKHLTQARAAGATERQIVMALSIARSVKAAAASKVEAVVQVASDKASGENMYCEAKPIVVGGARQTRTAPHLAPLGPASLCARTRPVRVLQRQNNLGRMG